jgi:hypothetical protein
MTTTGRRRRGGGGGGGGGGGRAERAGINVIPLDLQRRNQKANEPETMINK